MHSNKYPFNNFGSGRRESIASIKMVSPPPLHLDWLENTWWKHYGWSSSLGWSTISDRYNEGQEAMRGSNFLAEKKPICVRARMRDFPRVTGWALLFSFVVQIPISALVSFVEALEVGYSKHKNPYHNLMHAADVTQTVHYLLLKTGMVVRDILF